MAFALQSNSSGSELGGFISANNSSTVLTAICAHQVGVQGAGYSDLPHYGVNLIPEIRQELQWIFEIVRNFRDQSSNENLAGDHSAV